MMKKIAIWMVALVCLVSCGDDTPTPERKKRVDIPLSKSEEVLVANNNDFAFNLFRKVAEQKQAKQNTFISPLSVTVAFSMLLNGADGETKDEIREVLGYDGMQLDEINDFYQKILEAAVDIDPQVEVAMANSIWVQNGFPVLAPFVDVNKAYYQAEVKNVDFGQSQTLDQMNRWVSQQTKGIIGKMFEPRDLQNSIIYLVNALYFKGEWSTPFEKKDTKDEPFYNIDGSETKVPMMHKTRGGFYAQNEDYALTALPYGNGAFEMFFVLPNEGVDIDKVIDGLTFDAWQECMNNYGGYCTVKLKLPRFKTGYDFQLNDILQDLGMKTAFDSQQADFSLLSQYDVYLTKAMQKAHIEVDEKGTEAVASTAVGGEVMDPGPPRPEDIMEFYIDRPFLYFIREISTGTIFFMGQIDKM
ncbi:serine protease inhibitor [Parabacteroides sp. PFB2-12]|uniref:serpin family protein n=1 Tax=unclassified Parabacteroides TaxID=2649774 RepID=UPI0024743A3F|nr:MULTISPECIES: serpin family protein [unclassified Parabacteroides]MDH6343779.1 serine protease inhibitor [Parabacteroides sp. PM6-13]MDH6391941.1 serine protease inhibitor [Parabacteroides sp. PFB2-12]